MSKQKQFKLRNSQVIIPLLILSLSTLKYFYQAIEINPFEIDQEFLSLTAWKIIKDHKVTLLGAPTSAGGIFIGPVYSYFVSLVMVLTRFHPISVNILSATWATATPVAIYFVGKKLFSETAAIFAGLIAALSPSFLSIITTPPLVVPLALVSLLTFYFLSQISQKPQWIIFVAALVGLSLHLHFTGIYLMILTIIWLFKAQVKPRPKHLYKAVAVFILFISPLILFELRHSLFLSKNLVSFLTQSNSFNSSFSQSLQASTALFLAVSGELISAWPNQNVLIGAITSLLLLWVLFSKKMRNHHKLLFLWIGVVLALNALYSGLLLPYYFVISQVVFLLGLGLIADRLVTTRATWAITFIFLTALGMFTARQHSEKRNAFKLQNKMHAFQRIVAYEEAAKVNLSLTVDYARRGGLEFLRRYYGFDELLIDTRPTYTIVIPNNWKNIQPDIAFGEIGIVLP